MRMDAGHKMVGTRADGTRRIEKAVLLEAFAGVLPDEILWRQKEQFSDGVGYGWIDGLRAHAERQVGDEAFAAAATGFPVNPPQTKEAYWYRSLFEEAFPEIGRAHVVNTVPNAQLVCRLLLEKKKKKQ